MKTTHCLYCGGKKLDKVTHRSDGVGILECQKCKVMMVDAISDNTADLYTKDYFEKDEATDYGYSGYMSSPTADLIGKYGFARLFSDEKSHLDLGCADGSLMEIFDQEGFTTRGLEISQDAVDVVEKKGLSAEVSNLHKFPSDIKNIGIVTAYDLLEHADKPGQVLKNVYDILSDNGVFVFSTLSVKKKDPSDYWFSHSLEHYIYYNEESLTNVLEGVFGKGKFGFVEEEINGISEFWGFATKGDSKRGTTAISNIIKEQLPSNQDEAFHLSLFYNQVSKFELSANIIEKFAKKWSPAQYAEAIFYTNYVQGRLEKALQLTEEAKLFVPSSHGVFWRGYYQAEKDLSKIYRKEQTAQSDAEIVALREDVFKLNDEIHSLRGSRVVGRVIRARDIIVGRVYPKAKRLPRYAIGEVKNTVGFFLSMETKKSIGRKKRALKEKLKAVKNSGLVAQDIRIVPNEQLDAQNPVVSVVVPYYNRADTIDETLKSLKQQTFKNFEVILVNDGSSDPASIDKLDDITNEYSEDLNITIINQKNAGVAEARNNGVRNSKGTYIICLDSDDILTHTYIEKCITVLETDKNISLVTTYRKDFGVRNEIYAAPDYNARKLLNDNMVTTAAAYRKAAWERTSGYKPDIGYEDWEFWLSLAENGDWGRTLREPLFKYRVAMQSRFAEDKTAHWGNIKKIKQLHTGYRAKIKELEREKAKEKIAVSPETAFNNLDNELSYLQGDNPGVLIAIPWMTFGGAETLIYNYCRGLKNHYDISFVTGIPSDHEWEYKFREITSRIFHLPQLFSQEDLYLEFISNYVKVHDIKILHIIHSGYVFDMLPELRRRHPQLKIAVTMFNDRVDDYVAKSVKYRGLIDSFNTDSLAVANSFNQKFEGQLKAKVIPNGIDCFTEFNPVNFDRDAMRAELGVKDDEKAVFFVGRLSVEKNPDVYIKAMNEVTKTEKVKAFIIGDGPMKHDCEHMLKELKNKNIINLGYQSEVAKYLSACDIFVLPSSVEGFPLSILEAMSMNIAVVASRVGAVPDVIKDGKNGFVVEPGSAVEIRDAVLKLLEPTLLAQVKQNNRKEAEKLYSNEQLSARYNTLYRETIL